MEINKKDLENIIDQLKLELDEWFEDSISFDEDYYWEIDQEEIYQFIKDPTNFSLGQLTDDWSELLRLKDETEIPIKYDLQRLAVILRYLANYK